MVQEGAGGSEGGSVGAGESADASLHVDAHHTGSAVLDLSQSVVSTKAVAHRQRYLLINTTALLINTTAGRHKHVYTKHTDRIQTAEL